MRIIDVLTSPWAIMPEKLVEITDIYSRHLKGDKIDIKALEAKAGQPFDNVHKSYEVINGVAVLPIMGVIGKRMNLLHQTSGGVSTQLVRQELQYALEDEEVTSIVLQIDSPGGTVDGTVDLAQDIMAAREKKPVIASANGLMASAAYWIGSAASAIYIDNSTTMVGSIGVVSTHADYSEQLKQDGIKVTEIYAGKYKRLVSEYKPLSKEGKESMQEHVDYLYSLFVDAVAEQRGVAAETVLTNMADGRVFVGQQALDAGLIDGIQSIESLVDALASNPTVVTEVSGALHSAIDADKEELSMNINKEYLLENHADLVEAFRAEGAASVQASAVDEEALRKEGADMERNRIQAVLDQEMPGHEALIKSLAFDGVTTGEQAAIQVLKAEKESRATSLASFEDEAAEAVPAVADAAANVVAINKDLSPEDRAEAEWKANKNGVREEFGGDFSSYRAFVLASSEGKVKQLGGKA